MNRSLQYSALTRLLTLNNQVHDLENEMLAESVPVGARGAMIAAQMASGSRIAEIQEEIDRTTRASLATCWLGNSDDEDEEYGL
ncbi:MAG: hypothetical protein CL696_06695 [Chloroflexi bacterium]|nr:hypothetical protein [Chloroflexota bacterium]MDP6498069.1 hypothetical protein [Dehalococcoidia bacterium]MDP7586857.1 hypothetical protein [Dehalococcoidia bacterium]MQG55272.1 hypothetical protein [SAR202 cluster bacterium]|tara:strand:- start:4561 stop:4812 length:252 start_codon:yes stop_codon:yes gene_type:complete